MQAVGAIHVGSAGWPEHGGVAVSRAVEAVGGWVFTVIGLGLDNASADAGDEKLHANQGPGDLRRRTRVEGGGQRCGRDVERRVDDGTGHVGGGVAEVASRRQRVLTSE